MRLQQKAELVDRVLIALRANGRVDEPAPRLLIGGIAKNDFAEPGVRFAELLTPEEVEIDAAGAACALRFGQRNGETVTLPAKTILVAAGTQPNTVLAREDDHNVTLDGRFFQAYDENGVKVKPERIAKPAGSPSDVCSTPAVRAAERRFSEHCPSNSQPGVNRDH